MLKSVWSGGINKEVTKVTKVPGVSLICNMSLTFFSFFIVVLKKQLFLYPNNDDEMNIAYNFFTFYFSFFYFKRR